MERPRIYIGSGSLEAFSRPKLRLGIITCHYKLTPPDPEHNKELFEDYVNSDLLLCGPIGRDVPSHLYEKYKKQKTLWGEMAAQLEIIQGQTEVRYKRYNTALEKATENQMIIKV